MLTKFWGPKKYFFSICLPHQSGNAIECEGSLVTSARGHSQVRGVTHHKCAGSLVTSARSHSSQVRGVTRSSQVSRVTRHKCARSLITSARSHSSQVGRVARHKCAGSLVSRWAIGYSAKPRQLLHIILSEVSRWKWNTLVWNIDLRKSETTKVHLLEMKCLSMLVGVARIDRATNEEVRRRAGIEYVGNWICR